MPQRRERGGLEATPLEPAFLFSHAVAAERVAGTTLADGTTGRQFAQLLIRVWQETRHNDFPDIERAAEQAGKREMPLSLDSLTDICKHHGLHIRWFDGTAHKSGSPPLRSRFDAPDTVMVNRRLRDQEERLKYELAFALGHKILHNGDGMLSAHRATQTDIVESGAADMGTQDVLHAWRDFECSFFAGALLCPRIPFRRFLVRESHDVAACRRLGVTSAVVMRRMTAVSPYRYWHFFDAYPPGLLRAVYRGNGIPLPWGNMRLVSDPCPRWAVFQMLRQPRTGKAAQQPRSQISVMPDGERPRLYCCHSLVTRDAADVTHVLSVGVDLVPALEAQGYDGEAIVAAVADSCRRGGGDGSIPAAAAEAMRYRIAGPQHRLDRRCPAHACQCDLPAQQRLPAEPRRCPAGAD